MPVHCRDPFHLPFLGRILPLCHHSNQLIYDLSELEKQGAAISKLVQTKFHPDRVCQQYKRRQPQTTAKDITDATLPVAQSCALYPYQSLLSEPAKHTGINQQICTDLQ